MTLYQVLLDSVPLGIYSGQRPSAAACKAFSVLRRKNPDIGPTKLAVVTEGRKKTTEFMVEYKHAPNEFLKIEMQPIATKIQ